MKSISNLYGRLAKIMGFLSEYTQDLWMFVRFNGHSPFVGKDRRLFYRTIIQAHSIEKGLALGTPRPLFGREKIKKLFGDLDDYDISYSSFPVNMANGALSDYRDFNGDLGFKDPILDMIDDYLGKECATPDCFTGGVKTLSTSKDTAEKNPKVSFLMSRTSCRMFKPDALPPEKIEEAIKIAQSAPSQCNRQASKVHFYQSKAVITALLELQSGAGGFSNTIGNLFIITSEVSAWGGPQQRNQLYIDGALFSLTLILAFHALGFASCPLNLAVSNRLERHIKRLGDIPGNERVIMMIAVGEPENGELKAAKSPRRSPSEIMTVH